MGMEEEWYMICQGRVLYICLDNSPCKRWREWQFQSLGIIHILETHAQLLILVIIIFFLFYKVVDRTENSLLIGSLKERKNITFR